MLDLVRFLHRQRVRGFDPPIPERLMDPRGAAHFKQELAKATWYVEFGSGGTTLLADRAQVCTFSVENDHFYARTAAAQLQHSSVMHSSSTWADARMGLPAVSLAA